MAGESPTATLILLGCPKNRVDAETVLGSLGIAGYSITTEPPEREVTDQPGRADLMVIMTCAFLRSAVKESETAIRRAIALRRRNPSLRIVVAGCLVQRFGRELLGRFPQIELAAGLDYLTEIPRLLKLKAGYACSSRPARFSAGPRLLSTPRHYAYIKIADGCNNNCSYCMIPGIRGGLRSRRIPDIAAEAEQLAAAGVRELVLVAQDTTAYGQDLYRRPSRALPRLLDRLGDVPGIAWLRLMYTHPAHISPELIDQLAANPRVCRYIDMPVQHAADSILNRMNRGYTRTDVERLIKKLCAVGFHLRTTVIVGFPGETDADFRQLMDFVSEIEFDRLGAYPFSAERGLTSTGSDSTRAAGMRPQVPKARKMERLDAVMELQADISRRRLRRLRGTTLHVLMDGPETARTEWDAPEVDGIVRLRGRKAAPGEFVNVKITDSDTHDLYGRAVTP